MAWFTTEEEKDIEKRKGIVDRELEIYRREGMLRIEEQFAEARESERNNLQQLRKANVKGAFEAEHEFHHEKEQKETKLAKLDAEIKHKEELVAKADSIPELERRAAVAEAQSEGKDIAIDHLKEDVKRLDDLVKFLAGMLPKVELSKLGVTFNADVKVDATKKA